MPEWADLIEYVFRVRPKMHYGNMERVAFYHQCGETDFYHDNLDYGYTEIVDKRLICTGFMNHIQPIVKYDIGDEVTVNDTCDTKCTCGAPALPLNFKSIDGRCGDILEGADGSLKPSVNFYTLMAKTEGVLMWRIRQFAKSYVEVEVVAPGWESEERKRLAVEIQNRMGEGVKVFIKPVDRILRDSQTGKIRCVQNCIGG